VLDKLERQSADVVVRQQACLHALLAGRNVFLYTPELGILSRIFEGSSIEAITAIAPFFRPWILGRKVSYAMGDIGVEVPMVDLLLGGMADSVIESLKCAPCSRLVGLPWPNDVLNHLIKGKMEEAEQYLDVAKLRTSRSSNQWLEAACYWSLIPGKKLNVMVALDKADPNDLNTATGWYRLCGGHNESAKLMEERTLDIPGSDGLIRARCLKRADFWGREYGHEPSARTFLEMAERDEASNGAVSGFLCAMAWVGLFGEKDRALNLAEKAMCEKNEFSDSGAMWWRCFANDPERAEKCLKIPGMGPGTLSLVEQMLIHNGSPQEVETMLQGIRWESVDPVIVCERLCRAAKHWWFLFGNAGKSKLIMSRAITTAEETCDFLQIAETYLDLSFLSVADRELACRETLLLAESKSANPVDYVLCAKEWIQLLGDEDRAAECLLKAETQAVDPIDNTEVGKGWLEFIEWSEADMSIRKHH